MSGPGRIEVVFLDCDSTLSTIEGVDELAHRRGSGEKIAALTRQAMDGEIPLEEVYGRRLDLIRPDAGDLVWLGKRYVETLVPGARELVDTLQAEEREVHIVSGGLLQPVVLLARELGLPQGRVHAVPVELDEDGAYQGFDRNAPTARTGGKADIVERVAADRRAVMVGDGVTDLEPASAMVKTIGFGGVVARKLVQKSADAWVAGPSLFDVIGIIGEFERTKLD